MRDWSWYVAFIYTVGNTGLFAGIFVSYLRWDGGLYALE